MNFPVWSRLFLLIPLFWGYALSVCAQGPVDVMRGRAASAKTDTLVDPTIQKPQFPGGHDALMMYIADHVKYPKSLRRKKFNAGQLTVKFLVLANGRVRNVEVTSRPTPPDVAEEMSEYVTSVMKAFNRMPRWEPARVNGTPINYQYALPFQVEIE
ncbi:energy transducer TonB [Rudanella lutea]|uniref:energy transducer TonB n=1 Tax=Rudanella lutea TaxID=451374 RepID=UPI0009FEF807|nr:energy transducer TonB [Rudanella lutea]